MILMMTLTRSHFPHDSTNDSGSASPTRPNWLTTRWVLKPAYDFTRSYITCVSAFLVEVRPTLYLSAVSCAGKYASRLK